MDVRQIGFEGFCKGDFARDKSIVGAVTVVVHVGILLDNRGNFRSDRISLLLGRLQLTIECSLMRRSGMKA